MVILEWEELQEEDNKVEFEMIEIRIIRLDKYIQANKQILTSNNNNQNHANSYLPSSLIYNKMQTQPQPLQQPNRIPSSQQLSQNNYSNSHIEEDDNSINSSSNIEDQDRYQNRSEKNMSSEEMIESRFPFVIEKFTKEDRERERNNRPKLGLRRLTDDKKLASIDIDIPIDENIVIKEKFDWDLNKDKISPTDFSKELVAALNLPQDYAQKVKQQILCQIMQHIKANTRQKLPQELHPNNPLQDPTQSLYPNSLNAARPLFSHPMRFNNPDYQEQDLNNQQNQKKKMSRMRRKQLQRSVVLSTAQPNRYFKQKKICKNCKNENVTPGFQCKNCKLPFQLMEMVNMDDRRVKISVKYYEKIANKIPLLVYQAKKRHFQKEDFDSFYMIYNKIRSIFENSDQLSKQNLNQVKYIMEKYHQYFLNGQLDFNDEEIIYEKDSKKDQKEDENRPKRSRGRPRKIKIINEDLQPDSLGSDESSDDSSEQSYEQSQQDD